MNPLKIKLIPFKYIIKSLYNLKMEFPTNITKYFKLTEDGFFISNGKNLYKQINPNFLNQGTKIINQIINQLGANSAKSQGLKQIITTAIKFQGSDHRIYLKIQGNKAIGFLRSGQKKLFYHDGIGSMKQLNPTCVLDIYVHQNYQRSGIGKQIFEAFLRCQNQRPQKLAYDRPSPKLISFLKKHYGLSKFIPQNNNFVIFDQYFSSFSSTKKLNIEQKPNMTLRQDLSNPLNKTNKYEINNPKMYEQIPFTQAKQFNKTMKELTPSSYQNQNLKTTHKKQQKIQDSLSLLQKEMNRVHLKTSSSIKSGKQLQVQNILDKKETLNNIQNSFSHKAQENRGLTPLQLKMEQDKLIMLKAQQNKLAAYKNYAPWATSNDPIFRTTSNSYGSYYNNTKRN